MTELISKKDVIRILEEIAVLLELKGESPFKSIAYANAARRLETLEEDLEELVRRGGLTSIKGIGEALSKKITELVTTGRLEYYDKLRASIPPGHLEMLRIPGLGPKKIRALHEKLAIETLGELEYACMENHLVELPGFGARTQQKILTGIEPPEALQGAPPLQRGPHRRGGAAGYAPGRPRGALREPCRLHPARQ